MFCSFVCIYTVTCISRRIKEVAVYTCSNVMICVCVCQYAIVCSTCYTLLLCVVVA